MIENIDEEIWKPIKGYEGLYEVSNYGNVRSVDRIDGNGNNRKGIMRKHNVMKGYHCVLLRDKNGAKKVHRIHRLVMENFVASQPSPEYQVNHIDGNKGNNHVSNLEWVTPAENTAHAIRTGLTRTTDTEETRRKKSIASQKYWGDELHRKQNGERSKEMWAKRKQAGFTSWKQWKGELNGNNENSVQQESN